MKLSVKGLRMRYCADLSNSQQGDVVTSFQMESSNHWLGCIVFLLKTRS